jgi:hypothetical protein
MALSIFGDLEFDSPDIGSRRWITMPESPQLGFAMFPLGSCRKPQMR